MATVSVENIWKCDLGTKGSKLETLETRGADPKRNTHKEKELTHIDYGYRNLVLKNSLINICHAKSFRNSEETAPHHP